MQTFFFTSSCGQGLLLCDATRPPRGVSWRRQHFTRGQASIFVQSLPAHELRSLKFQLGSRYRIGALNPAAGLTQLLDSHRLSLYRKRPKPLKRQVEAPAVPSASELRLIIAASLKLIISRERAEALSLAKSHQRKSSTGKAAAHASALGQGLLASGTELVHWLGNSNDVVNPLWQLKRQVDAALITYEECTAASNGCLNLATRARYLKRVELADHHELVEALGFDPTTIDLDAFSQAWHSAWVLAGDKQVVALIGGFAKDYIDAQHALEYSRAAGNAVFEVLLDLLLAAATAGTGLAMGMASKARHAGEFGRVGRKLILLAEALEGSPRGIVRRRGETVRVVDGARGKRGRGERSRREGRSKEAGPEERSTAVNATGNIIHKKSNRIGKTIDELIETDLNLSNSLNGLAGEDFKKSALIDYHINPSVVDLTRDEYLSLHVYTTNLYEPINRGLRGLSPNDKEKWSNVSGDVDSALSKLAKNPDLRYEGDVFRGDEFSDELIEDLFPVGGVHQDAGFKSSSSNSEAAFPGNTTTVIVSRSGVKIDDISVAEAEKEVLFRSGTKFRVLSREKISGHNYIELEEL